ncbi:MAG: 2-amino-4-hydroxy-6-hydroxymethyldihydropteridine diphosphokinase [Prevotella sp.]|nr:2-amino-4-hydroxy-6-hydroxymethyldihydropteridine diphosphokinase [Prevotella sp.]
MEKKATLLIALGSNKDAKKNMEKARGLLQHLFKGVVFTSCIWTDPINIESDKFLNCLAYAETTHQVKQLEMALKQIERRCGDGKSLRRTNVIRMDIDILKYNDEVYHEKDWTRPYILKLLGELEAKIESLSNQ